MAFENVDETMTGATAAGDLSAYQYHFVQMTSSGIDLWTAGPAHGVLLNKPAAAGEPATVATKGAVKVVAGALVEKGVEVMADSDGHAITATSTNFQQGVCIEGCSAAGEFITIELASADYKP